MEWRLKEIHEDVRADDGERWTLIYEVPPECASDGTYTVSMPKDIATHWAAAYGYDPADPQDVEDLLDHVLYMAYLQEVHRMQGKQLDVDPFEMDPVDAKSAIKMLVENPKLSGFIGQGDTPRVSAARLAGVGDLHSVIRAELKRGLDHDRVSELTVQANQARAMRKARKN